MSKKKQPRSGKNKSQVLFADKKNYRLTILALVFLAIVLVTLLKIKNQDDVYLDKDHRTEQLDYVHKIKAQNFDFTIDDGNIAVINVASVNEALAIIYKVIDSPALWHEDDQAVRAYYKKISRSGKLKYFWITDENLRKFERASYYCKSDRYGINPLKATPEPLAMSIYHEMIHAVQCQKDRERFENMKVVRPLTEDCQDEAPAYGAQMRFFEALMRNGLVPAKMSSSDAGMVGAGIVLYKALLAGHFCEKYVNIRNISPEQAIMKIK